MWIGGVFQGELGNVYLYKQGDSGDEQKFDRFPLGIAGVSGRKSIPFGRNKRQHSGCEIAEKYACAIIDCKKFPVYYPADEIDRSTEQSRQEEGEKFPFCFMVGCLHDA